MSREVFDIVKKEGRKLALVLAILIAAMQIAFYHSSFFVNLRAGLSLFYLFVIPGYFILLYWHEKIKFIERTLFGSFIAAGLFGALGYYLGLMGLNVNLDAYFFPLITIIISILLNLRKKISSLEVQSN